MIRQMQLAYAEIGVGVGGQLWMSDLCWKALNNAVGLHRTRGDSVWNCVHLVLKTYPCTLNFTLNLNYCINVGTGTYPDYCIGIDVGTFRSKCLKYTLYEC